LLLLCVHVRRMLSYLLGRRCVCVCVSGGMLVALHYSQRTQSQVERCSAECKRGRGICWHRSEKEERYKLYVHNKSGRGEYQNCGGYPDKGNTSIDTRSCPKSCRDLSETFRGGSCSEHDILDGLEAVSLMRFTIYL